MKASKYFLLIYTIIICFIGLSIVKADCGDLIYEVTKLNVRDEKIVFDGWAFIHFTNNSKDEKVYGSARYGGGQDVMIVAENTSTRERKYFVNSLYNGYSGTNSNKLKKYNFYYMQFYDKGNADVANEYNNNYNHLTGKYDANSCNISDKECGAEECHQCLYEDIGFHIELKLSSLNLSDSSTYRFYIYATNDDFNSKFKGGICFGTKGLKGKINNLSYNGKQWAGSEIYIAEEVKDVVSNNVKIHTDSISKDELYVTVHNGMPRVCKNGECKIGNIIRVNGSVYIKNDYFKFKERLEDTDCNIKYKCGPGDYVIKTDKNGLFPGNDGTARIYRSWALPSGSTTLTVDFEVVKSCPVDKSNANSLSCNSSTDIVSSCDELTVKSGNESTTVSIKQTGTIANILTPKEIYNGGGIKFGLIYYNRVEFNYVSGSRNISITDIMNDRIKGIDDVRNDIKLDNMKVGNINVDSSYIEKKCNQSKGDNYVDTVCVFYFTPQIVNEDGTIKKNDVDIGYDQGINNKFYLPVEYNSVYRVSASILNLSVLNKDQAKKDGEGKKVWYGSKWDEVQLSFDSSCDINVYELGPGTFGESYYDYNESYSDSGSNSNSKVIYKFIYRPIDLYNPFPGINRVPGLNWYNWYNSNKDKLEKSYSNLQYSINLNNNDINKIKKYNSSNKYFNFDYDKFIKDTGIKVGGN